MTTCKHQIRDQYQTRNCLRKPTRDGYCYSHHPDSQKKAIDRVITNSNERKRLRRIQEAGPELLQALKLLVSYLPAGKCASPNCHEVDCWIRKIADEAIAKAKGRDV